MESPKMANRVDNQGYPNFLSSLIRMRTHYKYPVT